MKVLITIPCLKDPGGVASFYNSILPHLLKYGDIQITTFEMGSTNSKNRFLHSICDQIRFIRKIASEKFDIVHINPSLNFKSFIRDGMFVFWSKRRRLPVLVFFHGWTESFYSRISGALGFFFTRTYRKADRFIVLASDFQSRLLSKGVNKPIHILTTTVDELLIKHFSIDTKIHKLNASECFKLLFLSRIEKEKGVFETIDACKILLDQGHNIFLTIAGDGRAKTEVEKYIEGAGLSDKINMVGYVTGVKKKAVFEDHDIYCFPTYYGEGLPTSVLEAMAFGMPVVTRPVGGLKDFFENTKMGYLAESTQPADIADSIAKIMEDKEKLCHISAYNFSYAKENFMASKVAHAVGEMYAETFSSK